MGVSLSTARYLAPASFLIDFAAQQYGMLSTPNMKDIHDANLSFWSPQPFFIGGFFFPQQIFQLVWLWKLWRSDSAAVQQQDGANVEGMLDFTPYYTVGNLCIATWMIFWNSGNLKGSNVFVVINSLAQLYFTLVKLPQQGPMDWSSSRSVLTHVVAKTFAGIGVLDMLHNGSVAYFKDEAPSTLVKVATGLGFGALGLGSDWIFGGCLVYDLVAMAVGQRQYGNVGWSNMLGVYAAGTAAIVAARNLSSPPYIKSGKADYRPVS